MAGLGSQPYLDVSNAVLNACSCREGAAACTECSVVGALGADDVGATKRFSTLDWRGHAAGLTAGPAPGWSAYGC